MKILVISDLHYEKRVYHGVDESRAWEWLLSITDYHRPDYLLSCGDWGEAVTPEEFYELLRRTIVLTIYGNHENMGVLEGLYNIRTLKYLPMLMRDGRVYDVGGLRVAGINGIVATRRRSRRGVPRKTPEEFLEAAKRLAGKDVDVLLLHQTPFLPELFPKIHNTVCTQVALEAIRIIKPRVVVNGHMHSGEYMVYEFPWGTKYIYINSSQDKRYYLVIHVHGEHVDIEAWRDHTRVDTRRLRLITRNKV